MHLLNYAQHHEGVSWFSNNRNANDIGVKKQYLPICRANIECVSAAASCSSFQMARRLLHIAIQRPIYHVYRSSMLYLYLWFEESSMRHDMILVSCLGLFNRYIIKKVCFTQSRLDLIYGNSKQQTIVLCWVQNNNEIRFFMIISFYK